MKLGLLTVVDKDHASRRKGPHYVTFDDKTLQEFGASKFITDRLNTSEDIKVFSENNSSCNKVYDKLCKSVCINVWVG